MLSNVRAGMSWKLQGRDECMGELEIAGNCRAGMSAGVNWKLQGRDECRGELEIAGQG